MDAKVEKAVDLDRHFGRLPFGGFCDNAFPVWIPNLMLGVKCDNRESVHGSKESRFDAEHWVGSNPNPLRRVSCRDGACPVWQRGRTLTTE